MMRLVFVSFVVLAFFKVGLGWIGYDSHVFQVGIFCPKSNFICKCFQAKGMYSSFNSEKISKQTAGRSLLTNRKLWISALKLMFLLRVALQLGEPADQKSLFDIFFGRL